jgi:hypothetical protein
VNQRSRAAPGPTIDPVGSAVIVGCFFAGQSIGYRGVFLLMVIPGLLAISRGSIRNLRNLSIGTSLVIVLLMWGECLRLALYSALDHHNGSEVLTGEGKFFFWLIRELGWWWTVSVLLTMLADFVSNSPAMHLLSSRFANSLGANGRASIPR